MNPIVAAFLAAFRTALTQKARDAPPTLSQD